MVFDFEVPNMLYKFYTKSQAQAHEKKLNYVKAHQRTSEDKGTILLRMGSKITGAGG